jgi:hypothetical protein
VQWWSRAIDIAFIASFVFALPAAFVADLAYVRPQTARTVSGVLVRAEDATIHGRLLEPQNSTGRTGAITSISEHIVGNFTLSVDDHLRGWPLVTTVQRQPARLDIDILAEPKARTNVAHDAHDPYQVAMESALRNDDRKEALAAWNLDQPETDRHFWAWFPAFGAWWLMMFFAAAFVIQCLRFASLWLTGQRLQREARFRASGNCMSCGYDMTGLEFNERCPECGEQVW